MHVTYTLQLQLVFSSCKKTTSKHGGQEGERDRKDFIDVVYVSHQSWI